MEAYVRAVKRQPSYPDPRQATDAYGNTPFKIAASRRHDAPLMLQALNPDSVIVELQRIHARRTQEQQPPAANGELTASSSAAAAAASAAPKPQQEQQPAASGSGQQGGHSGAAGANGEVAEGGSTALGSPEPGSRGGRSRRRGKAGSRHSRKASSSGQAGALPSPSSAGGLGGAGGGEEGPAGGRGARSTQADYGGSQGGGEGEEEEDGDEEEEEDDEDEEEEEGGDDDSSITSVSGDGGTEEGSVSVATQPSGLHVSGVDLQVQTRVWGRVSHPERRHAAQQPAGERGARLCVGACICLDTWAGLRRALPGAVARARKKRFKTPHSQVTRVRRTQAGPATPGKPAAPGALHREGSGPHQAAAGAAAPPPPPPPPPRLSIKRLVRLVAVYDSARRALADGEGGDGSGAKAEGGLVAPGPQQMSGMGRGARASPPSSSGPAAATTAAAAAAAAAPPPSQQHTELSEHPVPDCYVCPLTCRVFRDPVVASDGFSYERVAIEKHIESGAWVGVAGGAFGAAVGPQRVRWRRGRRTEVALRASVLPSCGLARGTVRLPWQGTRGWRLAHACMCVCGILHLFGYLGGAGAQLLGVSDVPWHSRSRARQQRSGGDVCVRVSARRQPGVAQHQETADEPRAVPQPHAAQRGGAVEGDQQLAGAQGHAVAALLPRGFA